MSIQDDLKLKKTQAQDPFLIREGKFKHASLEDSFYHLDWAEESFLSGNHEKEMLRRTFDLDKLKYIIAFMGFLLSILIARAFWLQVIKGGYYYSMAEGNRIRTEIIEPRRGIIYDRNLKPLVRNEANFLLYLIPNDLPHNDLDRDNILRRLAAVLDSTNSGVITTDSSSTAGSEQVGNVSLISDTSSFYMLKEKVDSIKLNSLDSYQPLFITDNIDYQKALVLYLEATKTPGVFLSNKIRRDYLTDAGTSTPVEQVGPSSLAHILGYTGKINDDELKKLGSNYSAIDYVGKTGIEYSYEAELKGQDGTKDTEVDALGQEKNIVSQNPPVDGHNLLLSIDADLQQEAERAVQAELTKLGKSRASVVILDPNNGEVLTLVSWPGYDNNTFAKGLSQADYAKFLENPNRPLFNRAVSGEFPPGSTIKPTVAAMALQEKVITENTTVNSTGGIKVNQWVFPDWKAGGHGITDVKKALADSVNTFFYIVGGGYQGFQGLGIDRLVKYFQLFLLGKATGIDLPNEAQGFLPTPAWKDAVKKVKWYIGDTYHVSIGQGDLTVTPLQVADYTSFFANSGTIYQPHVVKKIMDSNNQTITDVQSKVLARDFIDQKNIEIVRAGLRQTITNGVAKSLGNLPVAVAGKTGTAQWSSRHDNQAWFTGFAPYDHPQVVITVLVEEGGEGSTAAVPIVHDILNWYFTRQASSTATSTAAVKN